MKKSEEEWRAQLTPEQFRIARQGGTERAFTGAYWDTKDKGVYRCICCGSELFSSENKYNSGSGWPSFWASYDGSIRYEDDYRLLVHRTEIRCATCDAHLGHVFDDGPEPSGKRYCVNSASLNLVKDES